VSTRIAISYTDEMDGSEEDWLIRLRSGDPEAAEAFVRYFGGRAFAVCRRLLKTRATRCRTDS
jgi:hypothetical protein